jgi:hypothetical protein
VKDNWSTDLTITTPIFSQRGSRKCLRRYGKPGISVITANYKMIHLDFIIKQFYQYLLQKIRSLYNPEQELSLDEGMIPWRGRLRFQTYKPIKIMKYAMLV